jgi:hypothetical protein
MVSVLGTERCDALTKLVLTIEAQTDLRAMRPLSQAGSA